MSGLDYVPLFCKSNFSFLEGASHPDELIEEAQSLGLRTLAITDRDGGLRRRQSSRVRQEARFQADHRLSDDGSTTARRSYF